MEIKEIIPNLNKPVLYDGGRYTLITGEIKRSVYNGELSYSAVLMDKNKNCVIHAPLKDVQIIKEESDGC